MKAHDSFLTSLLKLNDAVFNIPVYQRNYDWDVDNCDQLFSDIETVAVTGNDHFIGSIVYISTGTATEPGYNIIDGQQRITSIMLFLKALHDSSADEKLKKQIRYGFLINIGLDENPKMKLKQVESDRSVYEKIIMQSEFDEYAFSESEKSSNVYKNYQLFMTRIDETDIPLQALYNAVFKLEIIDVCLTTEDPQEIFESMNSTGKTLTKTDLLRNYLLMGLDLKTQERLYNSYWLQIERNVGANRMEQYMVHYLIMIRKSNAISLHGRRAGINKNTLYCSYKLHFPPDSKTAESTEALLRSMYRYSLIYKGIVNNDDIKSALSNSIHELIYELNAEPAAVFLMYLLSIRHEQNIEEDKITEAVKACISYVFRARMFKGHISEQFFALAIQNFDKADPTAPFINKIWAALTAGQGSYRFPKDREFQSEFESKDMYIDLKSQMVRYILYKYERRRTKEVVEEENATIEHILPQTPTNWKSHLAAVHDDNYLEYINKIGNLTLTKLNSEASNSTFDKKKNIYAKSGYAITREIADYTDWTSEDIRNRSMSMAKEALEIWPLPPEYNGESPSNESIVMNDSTKTIYDKLRDTIKDFYPEISFDSKKYYINVSKGRKIVLSIVPAQSCISVTFNSKKETLSPNDNLEDVSAKGHYGVGDCRIRVNNDDDILAILGYIDQIINNR